MPARPYARGKVSPGSRCPRAARRGVLSGRGHDPEFDRHDRRAASAPRRGAVSRSSRATSSIWWAWCRPRTCRNWRLEPAGAHHVIGAGEVEGKVRRRRLHRRAQQPARPGVRSASPPIAGCSVNSRGRAIIKTGQSCGVSVPLTAVLYGSAGTVVQVVRRARIETKRVEVGLTVRRPDRNPRGADRG